jgi:hypothetical protein
MLFRVYLALLFICFITGAVSIYSTKNLPRYLKVFPWFIFLTFLIEICGKYLFPSKTGPIYNTYALVEFIFFGIVLYHIIQNKLIKQSIVYSQCVYLLMAFINSCFIQGISQFNSISYLLSAVLLVFFSSYYLYELFFKNAVLKPLNEASFWIAVAILLFHTCSCPIVVVMDYLPLFSLQNLKLINSILLAIDLLYYSLFIIAFLCLHKFY